MRANDRRSPSRISPPQAVAVRAVAHAVVDRADRGTGDAVLGQAGREVRVVVLHADELDAVALERVGRGEQVGVQVVRDDLGAHVEEPLEVLDALAEGRERLRVAQVADVVADPRARPTREAERALQLGAARRARGRAQATGSAIAAGTSPRERRSTVRRPATTRATESSVRMWIGRSWRRKTSAIPASRSSASSSR